MLRPTPMRVLISVVIMGLTLSGLLVSSVFADDPLQKVESNDPSVQVFGHWSSQAAAEASGGSYVYSSGNPDDVLSLRFSGTSLTVIYVAGPQLGTLAVEVDGTVLRTLITTAATTQYGYAAEFDYLDGGLHVVHLYASDGIVAVDAIVAALAAPESVSGGVPVDPAPAGRGYDTLAALGEADAALGPSMTLYSGFDTGDSWQEPVNYLANVMGDWDGDGSDTFGTVYDGRFDYTNVLPDHFTNAEDQSASVKMGVEGYPVVGRFDSAYANDCIGVVAAYPEHPDLFALYYVCNFASPVVYEQYLGTPLADFYSGPYSFTAGDFNGDGLDTVAVWRDGMIAYTNGISTDEATFDNFQSWGQPFVEGGPATLVAGDWDGDGVDSFGVVYGSGDASYFYRRNDLGSDETSPMLQIVGATSRVAVWR